ncbi:hypothetical protein ACO2Q2_16810 [Dyella sp. KRB-257]
MPTITACSLSPRDPAFADLLEILQRSAAALDIRLRDRLRTAAARRA